MKFPSFPKNKYDISTTEGDDLKNTVMQDKHWKFFRFFHVTTGTFLIGLWHLAIHVFAFILFVSAMYLSPSYCRAASFYNANKNSFGILDNSVTTTSLSYQFRLKSLTSGLHVWGLMSIASLFTTILLIRGVRKKIPKFLLPFFFLQLFDLLFDFTILIGYALLSSNPNEFFTQFFKPPFQHYLAYSATEGQKSLSAVMYILISFSMKTYFMHTVYRCYLFLSIPRKSQSQQNLLTEQQSY